MSGMLAFFLTNAWNFFFDPHGSPWYQGNVYGNLVAIVPTVILTVTFGWVWSRTKFWPLIPLKHEWKRMHSKMDQIHRHHLRHHYDMAELANQLKSLHEKHDALHTKHDSLSARINGESKAQDGSPGP